ncbi:unnamed protein product, partial [Ectocarpus sp. 12 AP-2014]
PLHPLRQRSTVIKPLRFVRRSHRRSTPYILKCSSQCPVHLDFGTRMSQHFSACGEISSRSPTRGCTKTTIYRSYSAQGCCVTTRDVKKRRGAEFTHAAKLVSFVEKGK